MINLIPPSGRAASKFEYWVRATTVWGFLLTAVFIAANLLFVPTYVLITSQLSAASAAAEEDADDAARFTELESSVKAVNAAIAQLATPTLRTSMTEVLDAITRATTPGVELRYYEVARAEQTIDTIKVQGTAATRESLAVFRAALEREPLFESAAIPLSDLARDVDLPFVVTITLTSIKR